MAYTKVGVQINSPVARAFQQIVTAGWATKSSGNVEATSGAFALIHIEPAELEELKAACELELSIYPGHYVLEEDSDGNATLTEYLSKWGADIAYAELDATYTSWMIEGGE